MTLDPFDGNEYRKLYCGGSLVTPSYVLSAGHCFFERNQNPIKPFELRVVLGTSYLGLKPGQTPYIKERERLSLERQILTYVVHDEYIPKGPAYHDVALALIEMIQISIHIFPICLPNLPVLDQDHLKGQQMRVLGYSIKNENDGE